MRYEEAREVFLKSWIYAGTDQNKAHEIYHQDAILEFPQSGERFLGQAKMQAFREQYPAVELDFLPREARGGGDVWIGEGRALYDGTNMLYFVQILEFRGDLVQRESIYFAEPFPAPDWRKPWIEEGAVWEKQGDLPARITAGKLRPDPVPDPAP